MIFSTSQEEAWSWKVVPQYFKVFGFFKKKLMYIKTPFFPSSYMVIIIIILIDNYIL